MLGVASGAAHAANIAGHRAFYEMRMGQADKNAVVQSVSGRSAFILERDCDGWRSAEDYMIEFGNGDGRIDRIISHFESWGQKLATNIVLILLNKAGFQDDKDFGGYAEIDDDGSKAVFMLDAESNITLPKTPIFPCNIYAPSLTKLAMVVKFWRHRCSLVLNQMMPC